MALKPLSKHALGKIEIEVTDHGFTVWITEPNKGKRKGCRHWLLDGSTCLEDGEVSIGDYICDYSYHTILKDKRIYFKSGKK